MQMTFTSQLARGCALALALALMAGCSTGPAYVRPSMDVPNQFKEADRLAPGWTPAQPADAAIRGAWWQLFGDITLNGLEARVDAGNQDIAKAVAALEQAKAEAGVARSAYYPTITAGVAANRNHTSQNVVGRSLAGKTVSDFSGGLDVSWEPDLFGRIRHQVDAATARYQASHADLASVRLAMHAELALDYVDLRNADAQAALLQQTVDDYRHARDLVQVRVKGGIASRSDLAEAETQLQMAQAQWVDLGESRAHYEHAIATLVGVPPSALNLPASTAPMALPALPVGVPSTLLQRRPDIAAAERRVAAANADVGEATSAFFPDLLLSATGGFEASNFAQWAALPSRFWAIGPALVGTIFDGGRRKQQLKSAQAKEDAAAADYRQTVLTAFQDVEDNLASLRVLSDEASVQQRAVDAAHQAEVLAMTRYKAGATDYLEVVTTQGTSLAQRRAYDDLTRRQLESSIRLIKGLGGGWQGGDMPMTAAAGSRMKPPVDG
ncbi:efflux transporter, outer membrane factor (OMF) lipoprotein, NodT family [Dyella jiangningensis]|uniref:efflux transporter outer membrane subunit n=1 Tax=Dyella sp. AtDHG13 TaxID=1938897 RepID=UPI000889CC0E|nr:efflux transporter outer membrane subunit [Dyella sp. AtDHG13]PXV55884.1 NodT family efflux transporter outer membrane factor (OMF) lipoprotein [Dyella sp. AtDHG13]SDK52371.1 efflux transporter, outer membrane factor (OMF) lipoprotein, NodT family [Dyella jiangningensis]